MTPEQIIHQYGPREAMEYDVVIVGAGPAPGVQIPWRDRPGRVVNARRATSRWRLCYSRAPAARRWAGREGAWRCSEIEAHGERWR